MRPVLLELEKGLNLPLAPRVKHIVVQVGGSRWGSLQEKLKCIMTTTQLFAEQSYEQILG
jgi:hypothetical protein